MVGCISVNTAAGRILRVVTSMIEEGGPDAVVLQEVAKHAKVSLATVYRSFSSRDDLIAATVETWMDTEVYANLTEPGPDEPFDDALCRHFREIFEPWERSPRMAEAFAQARLGPASYRLSEQGANAIGPVARLIFGQPDAGDADDVMMIMGNVAYGLFFKFAGGELPVTEILPNLERTLNFLIREGRPTARAARSV